MSMLRLSPFPEKADGYPKLWDDYVVMDEPFDERKFSLNSRVVSYKDSDLPLNTVTGIALKKLPIEAWLAEFGGIAPMVSFVTTKELARKYNRKTRNLLAKITLTGETNTLCLRFGIKDTIDYPKAVDQFQRVFDAVGQYVIPVLIERTLRMIQSGTAVRIGHLTFDARGITVCVRHLMWSKSVQVPYTELSFDYSDDRVLLSLKSGRKLDRPWVRYDTDNALIVGPVCDGMGSATGRFCKRTET